MKRTRKSKVRRRRHHVPFNKRGKRFRADKTLKPWRVTLEYAGWSRDFDELLFRIAGKGSDGSGMLMRSRVRDHEWNFESEEKALEVIDQFERLPGICDLQLTENVLEKNKQIEHRGLERAGARILSTGEIVVPHGEIRRRRRRRRSDRNDAFHR